MNFSQALLNRPTRCVGGRTMRHDPQPDDPGLETDIGQCEECAGKGCYDAEEAERKELEILARVKDEEVAAAIHAIWSGKPWKTAPTSDKDDARRESVAAASVIWGAVNALGGSPYQDNPYDQGFVDAISKALEVIEAFGGCANRS